MTQNDDVRAAAKAAGVRLWQVAEALGICDTTLSKYLRHEWTDEQKAVVLEIISNLSRGEGHE